MVDERRDIVIVGGGAIGLSIAYHLGRLGCGDVLLLERDRLTSGSSWHAAGIVGPLRASMNLTTLARYGIELFGRTRNRNRPGDRIPANRRRVARAKRPERLVELRRIKAHGRSQRARYRNSLTAERIAARLPFLHSDDLAGGLWVEQDGQVNPVDLCMAYAKGAKAQGIEIRESTPVVDIETGANAVQRAVLLAGGDRIECGKLVLCAGAWSRHLGATGGCRCAARLPVSTCTW